MGGSHQEPDCRHPTAFALSWLGGLEGRNKREKEEKRE
jgi:hypothetical protein